MDVDKGLELSLGLPSSDSKEISDNSSDERTSKILDDFINFLNAGVSQPFKPVSGDKRKNTFDDTTDPKRPQTETTDECSTAGNDDVADDGSSQVTRDHGKVNISGPHFPIQRADDMNVPFSINVKESPSASAPSTSYQMRAMCVTNGERRRPHTANPGDGLMSNGYSIIQLSSLDKGSPWGMAARSKDPHCPCAGRALSASVPAQVTNPSSSTDQSKGETKQLIFEVSSSHSDDDNKGKPNNFPSEYPSIRPGIAADVIFGGSGSYPNLPWVSTTGPGPNGKTISGVTYKYNETQIKIVCACHGTHMSPDEFVEHAAEDQPSGPATPGLAQPSGPTTPGLALIRRGNPAASTRS